ncbi:transcription elongation factor GreA [Caldisericum exile]|uniref:Transcription elongation factor GreA n=1 Tax=Caldisericum exile (strain DSM 21853 / NBRC 104410 / AZM16c01) TaxID=511051 RepID=A0A7U6GFC9_CALEA|nr:transcription elongation factor GreA [Caldisericum exile]BAL81373.1 transcription elongation factor GreA [Caldisericum exile AZM16c01]
MEEQVEGKIQISRKGYEELKKELEERKTVIRQEISERIKQAITFGDLSENSEYDAAKQEQAFNESRIAELEAILSKAEIIDEDAVDTDKVNIGCKVELKNLSTGKVVSYYIVGPAESDPDDGKISSTSPVGRGLIGHKVNEIVEIQIPKGTVRYKILKIVKGD